MNPLRESAIAAYRLLTLGWRKRLAERFTRESNWPAGVLFYHRVADSDLNDWTIGTKDFRRHLDWLGRHAEVVSLAEIQKSQSQKSRSKLQVAITFDDGYLDSAEIAVPLLVDRLWPSTVFVSTHFAETGLPFPHDSMRGVLHRPNTIAQIQWMSDQGVEIGCHTQSHASLARGLSPRTLRREIHDCRKQLQDWTGQPIHYFAFPYGMPENMSREAIDAVFNAGFHGYLSAFGAWNFIGDNPFHIRRIHGQGGIQALANWLSLDPRKFKRRETFDYIPPKLRGTGLSVPPKSNEKQTAAARLTIAKMKRQCEFVDDSWYH